MHRDYSACLVHNQRIAEWTQRVSECRSCRPKRGGQDSDFFRDVLWRSVRYCAVFSTARNQVPDLIGYEKTTKPLALWFIIFGGDKRDRTADLLNAIQALSQLSYTPMCLETLDFTGFPGYSIFRLFLMLRCCLLGCLRS